MDTAEAFVRSSQCGYSAAELKDIVHVKTKHARKQGKARKVYAKQSSAALYVSNPDLAAEEAKATILLFCTMLDERQRRLYAGLESLKLGHGGDAHIASLMGMDPHTVARGRRELISGHLSHDRIRGAGGGRVPQEKKRPKS